MRWNDEAIVLAIQGLGENKKVVTVLTRDHGRHKGVWRRTKSFGCLQPGQRVLASWYGRLEEQLGTWSFESGASSLMFLLQDKWLLMAAQGGVALCDLLLPEREHQGQVYESFRHFLQERTLESYCFFELTLLNKTSFPLDLQKCALEGDSNDLAYVSPRTGRAVSKDMAGDYASRLLKLPKFLWCALEISPSMEEIVAALSLTGYFLERYSLGNQGCALPLIRQNLMEQLMLDMEGTRLYE